VLALGQLFKTTDPVRERPQLALSQLGAEGATAPETLRQKDRTDHQHSEELPDVVTRHTAGASAVVFTFA
jgi:hypothetical protein